MKRWLTVLATLACASHVAVTAAAPNIILILADDLGYGDVRCLNPNGKIPSPHLDKLSSDGVVFTDAHTPSSVCTPTRYGLLTGRYCWRTKLQSGVLGGLSPRLIEPSRETVASILKKAGYETACVGKWHLGMDWVIKPGKQVTELSIEPREQVFNVDYGRPVSNGPLAVGFDSYFGISASLDMVPYAYIKNDRLTVPPTEDRDFLMRPDRPNSRTRKGPTAPGFEVEGVLPDLIEAAVEFVSKPRDKPFFLYLPLTAPHTPVAPSKDWTGKTGLGPYGDFVAQTDHAVGEVLAAVDRRGITHDTLVIFTSDNGCSPQADFEDLAKQGHNPSYIFRGHKADIYDGGHRVPLIVRWPGVVKPGSKSDRLVCLTDVFRTVAEVVGAPVPDSAGEDGVSFLPSLRGEKQVSRPAIVHHSINGSFAIRDGKWKLCLCPGSGGWSSPRPGRDDQTKLPPVQLYDMESDAGESTNLQASHPDVVERLTKLLDQFVADGRGTPGPPGRNAARVDVWKGGRTGLSPITKKN